MKDHERIFKRTCTSLRIHALRHNGSLTAQDLRTLNLPTTPEVLEDVLLHLQAEQKLRVTQMLGGEVMYDFLPFLEEAVENSVLDMPTRLQLAKIYLSRRMWSAAITELRVTRTHPKFKKESLYLLGTCFEEKGAWEKAREYYERALALDYFYRDVLERLDRMIQRGKQRTEITSAATMVTTQEAFHPRLQERYEIVRELGRGGAGIVYQAIDLKLKRDVALKILYRRPGGHQSEIKTFLQEARVAAQLDHPNIIDIYDVDLETQCIAMEYVNGGTLRELLARRTSLTLPQTRAILLQLCKGLHVAHQAGVLHRDIKPANIFISKKKHIKLGDFGIAHLAKLDQTAFTQLSAQIGTLPYMSPEQVQGNALSPASDMYAVGILFYEMLTGAPPFVEGDIAYHHRYSVPQTPDISPSVDAIILHCLEKNATKRFQSADEFMRALRKQELDEKQRIGKYRDLLSMALIDKELSRNEYTVLQLKRKSLNLTAEEARRVEQELGVTLPSFGRVDKKKAKHHENSSR